MKEKQTSKNEGIFCEIVFVGVRCYGRERFRKKQEMTGIFDESPRHYSFILICAYQIDKQSVNAVILAVE